MKPKLLHCAALLAAAMLTPVLGSPSFAMGCAQTFEGFGRARNSPRGETLARAYATGDWENKVRKSLPGCNYFWHMARDKSVSCDAGMGHIECHASGEPGPGKGRPQN